MLCQQKKVEQSSIVYSDSDSEWWMKHLNTDIRMLFVKKINITRETQSVAYPLA